MLRESKKSAWFRTVRSKSRLAAVSHRARTPRQSSFWERAKIGRWQRIHAQKLKKKNHRDTNIQIDNGTSRRVDVKSTLRTLLPVDFEAPCGGLGSFSCKRTTLLGECLLRATRSVLKEDEAINLRGGRTFLTCPTFTGVAFLDRKAMAVSPAGILKWNFQLRKIWLTFKAFCGF